MSAEDEIFKNKRFSDSVRRANDKSLEVQLLPTGLVSLDVALGGGLPRGRSVEFLGDSGTAKTAVIYLLLVSVQKKGGMVGLVDTERAYDPEWFAQLGGNPEKLLYCKDTTVEGIGGFVFEFCTALYEEQKKTGDRPGAVGFDSIAHASTKHLMAEGMDKVDMGFAKAITTMYRYINGVLSDSKVVFAVANQVRDRISQDPSDKYKGTHSSGGKMAQYSPSTRIELKLGGGEQSSRIIYDADKEDGVIGRFIRGTVIKKPLWCLRKLI